MQQFDWFAGLLPQAIWEEQQMAVLRFLVLAVISWTVHFSSG